MRALLDLFRVECNSGGEQVIAWHLSNSVILPA